MRRGFSLFVMLLAVLGATTPPVSAQSPTELQASNVLEALKEAGLPITDYQVFTATTDPNNLLGRPNGYVAKANFRDARLETYVPDTFSTEDGGSVEVFATAAQADRRKAYIDAIGASSSIFVEYSYLQGPVLLRLSKRLLPEQAAEYEGALAAITLSAGAVAAQLVEEPAPPPASADFYPSRYLGQGDAFNCADFISQADAQAVLRADPSDPNRLDQGGIPGVACESNRAPRDTVPVLAP